jgi:hypothetical protein
LSFNGKIIELLTETLALLKANATEPAPEIYRPEPPPPRKLRQSEQKGVDMNDLLRAADAERRRRPLPRKPSGR